MGACSIKGAAFDLAKHQGLLAWISGQIATQVCLFSNNRLLLS